MTNTTLNSLSEAKIRSLVNYDIDIIVRDSVNSTNTILKETDFTSPLCLIANSQTAGRGRLGRSFESPAGTGIYMSIGLQPDFPVENAVFITMAIGVALCEAIKNITGTQTYVKWVNDIVLNQKKIAGILTEAITNSKTGRIEKLIIGVGINCFKSEFSNEVRNIAGYLAESPLDFDRNLLAAEIIRCIITKLKNIKTNNFIDEYKKLCIIPGKKILIKSSYNGKGILADAIDIADDGGLIVKYLEGNKSGKIETVYTGEVSTTYPQV